MTENTVSTCDEIKTGLLKTRCALDLLEQPDTFKSLTVQELRLLKEYKTTMFIQVNRLEKLLQAVFNQEK